MLESIYQPIYLIKVDLGNSLQEYLMCALELPNFYCTSIDDISIYNFVMLNTFSFTFKIHISLKTSFVN